jgi:hypothetical protein
MAVLPRDSERTRSHDSELLYASRKFLIDGKHYSYALFYEQQIYILEMTWGLFSGTTCTLTPGADPKETRVGQAV